MEENLRLIEKFYCCKDIVYEIFPPKKCNSTAPQIWGNINGEKIRMVTGRLRQKITLSWRMALTFTGRLGGYWLWSKNCKQELSTEQLSGNGEVQGGSTEWERRGKITVFYKREWSRCHLIWIILIYVSVCIVVWWFIYVVIFTNAVIMHSTLSKHWPYLFFSCQCQGGFNGDWVWCHKNEYERIKCPKELL